MIHSPFASFPFWSARPGRALDVWTGRACGHARRLGPVLAGALVLAGCSGLGGDWPSLAHDPIDDAGPVAPIKPTRSPSLGPPQREGHADVPGSSEEQQAFLAEMDAQRARLEDALAALQPGDGPGDDRWARAQLELSRLSQLVTRGEALHPAAGGALATRLAEVDAFIIRSSRELDRLPVNGSGY